MSINVPSTTAFIPDVSNINVVENTEDEEIICRWHANEFVVYLIKEHDSIKYKTLNRDQKEIYTNCIGIPESKSLERMLSHLKQCTVMVDENGVTRFLKTYSTWTHGDTEISLVRKTEGLAWNIFNKITNETSFFNFKNIIPSLQCHPKTVVLIEKIKNEAPSNVNLLRCLMKDFNVRVIDSTSMPEEFKALERALTIAVPRSNTINEFMVDFLKHQEGKIVNYSLTALVWMTFKPCVSSINDSIIKQVSEAVSKASKIYLASAVLGFLPFIFYRTFLDRARVFTEVKSILQKRIILLSSKPLFIEVEPISMPSAIDERVRVSKLTWAVTLVTHKGIFGNHAQVIIEGINDGFFDQESDRLGKAQEVKIGEKFIHLADFSPKIKYGLISPNEFKYETRTETWMRSSDQVKKMLEAIEETRYLPEDKKHPFNFFGKRSKLYKFNPFPEENEPFISGIVGDNCFTFLREKLKMIDIDVGESYVDLLAAIVKIYTQNKKEFDDFPVRVQI